MREIIFLYTHLFFFIYFSNKNLVYFLVEKLFSCYFINLKFLNDRLSNLWSNKKM